MASLRKRGRVWYYRVVQADGTRPEIKGCSDRRQTEAMAAAAEAQAAKVREGLIDARDLALRDHGKRPIGEHLDAFKAHLEAKGGTPRYVGQTVQEARRLIALASGAEYSEVAPARTATRAEIDHIETHVGHLLASAKLAVLDAGRIQAALKILRDAGLSPRTRNSYRGAIKGFSAWAWKSGRLPADPLVGLVPFNNAEDVRHDRRTISLDELRRLVAAAHSGPRWRRMGGPARALCYRLAASTGLRHNEIRSITPESFDWSAAPPTVTVEAGCTKNRQGATCPLPDDLAEDLRPFVAHVAGGEPVFPMEKFTGAKMLRPDLERAGIAYEDAGGRVFDFHSLRCQLATSLDAAGVTPRVVQKLMRHSSLELTGKYTRPRAVDLDAAALSVPSLRPETHKPEAPALPMTGTEGANRRPQTRPTVAPRRARIDAG